MGTLREVILLDENVRTHINIGFPQDCVPSVTELAASFSLVIMIERYGQTYEHFMHQLTSLQTKFDPFFKCVLERAGDPTEAMYKIYRPILHPALIFNQQRQFNLDSRLFLSHMSMLWVRKQAREAATQQVVTFDQLPTNEVDNLSIIQEKVLAIETCLAEINK
jgi:hypothetical protein